MDMDRDSSLPTVIVTETLSDQAAQWLGRHVDLVWCSFEKTDELNELLATAQGLVVRTYTQVNEALLARAPRLKVVGRAGVGLDNIDVERCRARGVEVVYSPDANTQAVVEYVLGLMLDALRPRTDLPAEASAEVFHQLRKSEVGQQLDQMCLGIVGFGRIGKRLGQVAHALGMNLNVCDLLPEAQLRKAVDYPFEFMDCDTLYGQSEIVSVHVDGRPSNRHMLNRQTLGLLKDDCLLINTARGMLQHNEDLAAWAKGHPRARVVLDVHEPEPPGEGYVLAGLANVRLLPHLASRTGEALENMSWVVYDVAAVLEGKSARHPAP
jgi:phosphoglycerate dehydrogenase-like enzyme